MTPIMNLSSKYNIPIVEDSAQAMGSFYKNKHGGTFGISGAVSCHPLKNLNALGDGGLLLTNSDEVAKKVRLYRETPDKDGTTVYDINFKSFLRDGDRSNFVKIKPNDTIIIKQTTTDYIFSKIGLFNTLLNILNIYLQIERR